MSPSLTGALPELRDAFTKLQAIGANHGITFVVAPFGGVRTQADTNRILKYRDDDYAAALRSGAIKSDTTKAQFRPINPFGKSFHNYGAAFDVDILSRPSGMSEYAAQKFLGQFAPSLGMRWGGLFKNPNPDPPHFELAISLDEAKKRYARMQGPVTLASDVKPAGDPFAFSVEDFANPYVDSSKPDPTQWAEPTQWDDEPVSEYEETVIEVEDTTPTLLLWAGLAVVAGMLAFWGMHGRTR